MKWKLFKKRKRKKGFWKSFFIPFGYRVLSGLQNAFGYAMRRIGVIITSVTMVITSIKLIKNFKGWKNILASILLIIGATAGVLIGLNFLNIIPIDIHLMELITTSFQWLAMALSDTDIPLLMASVYPALLLHKGFINLGSGQNWFYTGTDDPSGRTFGFKWLKIKIPRMGNGVRYTLGGLSLVYMLWRLLKSKNEIILELALM